MAEPLSRYSAVSLTLHWVTAAAVVGQILLVSAGDAADSREAAAVWRDLHKSVGMSILVLTLARIGWRLANPGLKAPEGTPAWERFAAKSVHVLFYVVLLTLPLTGWLASSAAGRDVSWFGLFNWPLAPIDGGREAAGQFMDVHRAVVKGLYVLVALHVLAALKHQFLDRDNVLRRMLPFLPERAR